MEDGGAGGGGGGGETAPAAWRWPHQPLERAEAAAVGRFVTCSTSTRCPSSKRTSQISCRAYERAAAAAGVARRAVAGWQGRGGGGGSGIGGDNGEEGGGGGYGGGGGGGGGDGGPQNEAVVAFVPNAAWHGSFAKASWPGGRWPVPRRARRTIGTAAHSFRPSAPPPARVAAAPLRVARPSASPSHLVSPAAHLLEHLLRDLELELRRHALERGAARRGHTEEEPTDGDRRRRRPLAACVDHRGAWSVYASVVPATLADSAGGVVRVALRCPLLVVRGDKVPHVRRSRDRATSSGLLGVGFRGLVTASRRERAENSSRR